MIDRLTDAGFVDTFRMFNDSPDQYSWWSQRSGARSITVGWRVDYFFVNDGFKSRIISAQIHDDVQGSDHCPVAIEVV